MDTRRGRVVVDYREIEGFMGAITTSFSVEPKEQIMDLGSRPWIRLVIAPDRRAIVDIEAREQQ